MATGLGFAKAPEIDPIPGPASSEPPEDFGRKSRPSATWNWRENG